MTVNSNTAGGQTWSQNDVSYNDISNFGLLNRDLAGVYLCCSLDLTGTRVHHNRIHQPGTGEYAVGVYLDAGSGRALIDHNVIWAMSLNGVQLNIYNSEQGTGVNYGSNRVVNNTVVASETMRTLNGSSDFFANNVLDRPANFANELTNFKGDADFVNPAAGDFHLLTTSGAKGFGMPVSSVTTTSPVEAGAYEGADWTAGCSMAECSYTPIGYQRELLRNSGFESRTTSQWSWSNGMVSVPTTGVTGCCSVALDGANAGVGQIVSGLKPNTTYRFRATTKAAYSAGEARIGVKNFGGPITETPLAASAWTPQSVVFTTGASSTSAEVYIWTYGGTSGAVAADDFALAEIVANAGLESDTFEGWTWTAGDVQVRPVSASGYYSLRASGASAGIGQVLAGLKPSTTYVFGAWTRASTAGGPAKLGVKNFGGAAVEVSIGSGAFAWTTVTFTTGAVNTSAEVFVWTYGGGSGAVYADDFKLSLP